MRRNLTMRLHVILCHAGTTGADGISRGPACGQAAQHRAYWRSAQYTLTRYEMLQYTMTSGTGTWHSFAGVSQRITFSQKRGMSSVSSCSSALQEVQVCSQV